MFDFAWSEIALIGIVALVAIGPKDLPVAIKAVAGLVKKARRMAGEFQVHVDEMVREADLHEVRREFNDLRRMDIKGKILNAMDGDGTIRKTMAENPLAAETTLTTPPPLAETVATETVATETVAGHAVAAPDAAPELAAPAFVPPTAEAVHSAPAAPPMIPPADAKQPSLHG